MGRQTKSLIGASVVLGALAVGCGGERTTTRDDLLAAAGRAGCEPARALAELDEAIGNLPGAGVVASVRCDGALVSVSAYASSSDASDFARDDPNAIRRGRYVVSRAIRTEATRRVATEILDELERAP